MCMYVHVCMYIKRATCSWVVAQGWMTRVFASPTLATCDTSLSAEMNLPACVRCVGQHETVRPTCKQTTDRHVDEQTQGGGAGRQAPAASAPPLMPKDKTAPKVSFRKYLYLHARV